MNRRAADVYSILIFNKLPDDEKRRIQAKNGNTHRELMFKNTQKVYISETRNIC